LQQREKPWKRGLLADHCAGPAEGEWRDAEEARNGVLPTKITKRIARIKGATPYALFTMASSIALDITLSLYSDERCQND
jgi:hypothetical protein